MGMRIVSWNIQKGIGVDLRRDLGRTTRVLRELSPDVVGLQEVLRIERCDQAAELARSLDLQLAWGTARPVRGGTYGNALLVRGRVLDTRVHDLRVGRHEPRICLEVLLEVRGTALRVFVCHLGLSRRERADQIARVVGIVREARSADPGVPRIVLGDFNEWRGSAVATALAGELDVAPRPLPTHPSPWPMLSLDRVAWDAPLRGTVHVAPVGRASDHRALAVTLDANSA
jgi:endonuclease/exonuclease/phosphatase family metal-dependent hydrolase